MREPTNHIPKEYRGISVLCYDGCDAYHPIRAVRVERRIRGVDLAVWI